MIEGLIYFSPMLILLIAVFILMFGEHEEDEQYRCFRFSRIMLLSSFVLEVIFYNKPSILTLSQGTRFTLVFESLLYGSGLMLLYLSRKWFTAMHRQAYIFCGCLFLTLMFGSLLVSSTNLGLTVGCAVMLMSGNYIILRDSNTQKDSNISSRIYLISSLFCALLLTGAAVILRLLCGSLDYEALRMYFDLNQSDIRLFAAAAMLIVPFLFLTGLAPMHFWLTETFGRMMLPVFVYFVLMSGTGGWGGFIHLNIAVLAPLAAYFKIFYVSVALLSIGVGAVGACGGQNIRKIFAYIAVYNAGIILLTVRRFTVNALNAGFGYMFTYLLAMCGICTCLFGLKRKGEYLFMLSEFEGASQKRPYISAMMVIFMFSLLGLPPFSGFLGLFSALNYQALHHHFYQLIYLLIMMLVVGYAFLQIVRALYFEERKTTFDKADSGIYTAILLNAVLMLLIMILPQYLTEDVRTMLETVLQ
ncbi:MAG: hypothetical protein IJ770_05360 [Alphaproteobacteria bacterium]|nr:hypothetical protein [Alphaproteobacteria bacterium]